MTKVLRHASGNVRRHTEVAEVVEGTEKVKNEGRGKERHGGGRGCGGG